MTREEINNELDRAFEVLVHCGHMDMRRREAFYMAIQALSAEPCEDVISRHDAIHLADELKDDLPDDERMADMVTAHNEGISEYQTKLSLLPPVTPKQKMGHWRHYEGMLYCSKCGAEFYDEIMEYTGDEVPKHCPDCGAKMGEIDGRK